MNITRVQARLFSDLRPSGWNVHRWPSIDDSKTYPDSATARYLKSLVNNDMGAILSTLNRVRFAGHEVGVISYNTMLKVLAKKPAGDRTAKMIMQQMRSHGIGCDSETYELLVKIFHKAGCREAVEQLLKEMRGKDFPVTEASLSTELHVAITEDQRDAIVRKATKTMTNPVMVMQRAVLSSSSFNEAIRRMRDIEEFAPGAELTLENFTKLIHFCKGNTKASNELFLASKEAGLEPDVVLWTALLNSHRLALDFTGFIDAFKSMTVLPNAYTLTVFIHALVAAPLSAHVKVQVGVSIWKLALPLDPTFHLHTAMARLYNQVNCTDGAKSLIRFLKESGAKVPRIIEELVLETETNTTRKKQTSISEEGKKMDFGQLDHRLSVIARDVTNAVGRVAESRILMQMGRDEASAKHMQELLVEMLRGVVSGEQEAEVQRLSERNKILEVQLETCRGKLREVETALRQTKTEMEGKGETEWERDLKISQLEGRLEASEGNLKAVQDRYRKEIANSTIVPENYFQKQQQNETSIMWEAHAASQTAKQLETLRISAASITSLLTRYDPTLTVSGMLDVVGGVASRCMEFFVPIFASPYEVQRISEARSVVHEYMSKLKTTHRKLKAALRDKDTSLRDSQDTSSLQNALRSLELDLSKSNQRRQRAEQAADSWREKHGSLEMEVSKIQSELSRQETDHKMHTLLSTHMSDVLKVVHTMQAANTAVAAGTGQSNVSNNSDVNATNAFLSEFQSYLTTAIGKERQQQQQQQPPQQPAQEKEKEQDISLHYIPKAAHMQEMHELETHLLRDTKGWVEKKEISWEKTLHDTQQKLETAKDERDKMALTNIEKSNLINMLEARVASLTSELTESKRGATLQKERRSLAEQAVAALKAEVMTLQKAMPVEVSPLPPPPPSSDLPSIHTLLHDGIASLLMELRCLDLGHGTEQIRDLLEDGCQGDLSEVDVTKMIKAKVRVALRVCTASLQRVKRVQTIHAEKIFNMKRRLLGEVSTVRSAAAEVYSTAKAEVWQMAVEVEKAGEAIVGAMGAIRAPTPPPAPSYAETVRPMTAIAPLLQQHLEGVSESVLGVLADPVSEVTFVLAVAELETVLKRNSTTAKRVQEELLGLQKEHSALGTAQHQTLAELEGAKGEVSEAMKTIDSLQRKIRSAVEANEKSEGEARAARGEAEAALSKAVEEKEGVRAAEGELNNVIAGQREDIAKLTANIDRLEDEIAQTDKKYAENLAAIKRRATELESQLRNEKESHQLSALQHENQVATLSDDIQRLQREVERAKKDRDSSHKRLEDTETEHENQHTALQSMYRATVERLQAEGQLNEKLITQNAEKDREIAKLALQTSREKA